MRHFPMACGVTLTLLLALVSVRADEPAVPAPDLKPWVQNLSDSDPAVRDAAVKKLTDVGKAAVPLVVEAANGENATLETMTRCVSVLTELRKSKDQEAVREADAALRKMAEGSNKSLARRAQAVIGTRNFNPLPQNRIMVNRAMPLNVAVQGVALGTRVSIRSTNGNIEAQVTDGGRSVRITKKTTGQVEMEITERDSAGKTTQVAKHAASSLEVLRRTDPDAARIVDKYLNNALQARARGPLIPLPAGTVKTATDEMAKAQETARKASERLKQLSTKGAKPEDIQAVSTELEGALKQADGALSKLQELLPK